MLVKQLCHCADRVEDCFREAAFVRFNEWFSGTKRADLLGCCGALSDEYRRPTGAATATDSTHFISLSSLIPRKHIHALIYFILFFEVDPRHWTLYVLIKGDSKRVAISESMIELSFRRCIRLSMKFKQKLTLNGTAELYLILCWIWSQRLLNLPIWPKSEYGKDGISTVKVFLDCLW